MKTYKLLIYALSLVVLSLSLTSLVFAQKSTLPSGLTKKSSLKEILDWLDKTGLAQARIGLSEDVQGIEPDDIPNAHTGYSEWAVFSQGFKLTKIDGCKITLRNDGVKLISFTTKYPNPAEGSLDDFRKTANNQSKYAGELFIPLQKLKAKKAPYRHTKKTDQANLLGTWRTEFTRKFEFFIIPTRKRMKSLLEDMMEIEIIGAEPDGGNDSMNGDTLTFTFDDKQVSENFYAVFRQAIILCKEK